MKLEIVIPVLSNDLDIFLLGYKYIMKNLPCKKIVLIGDAEVAEKTCHLPNVFFIDENNLLEGLSISEIKVIKKRVSGSKRRAGWYFQQFLKMGYAKVCRDEYYLIWDADTIPVNPIEFFNDKGKPYIAFRDFVKVDKCFDAAQDCILPDKVLHKTRHRSYITEHMLINVKIMRDLINKIEANNEVTGYYFFEKIMYCVPRNVINLSGFSEFELYAAFIFTFYPDKYEERKWKNLRNAKLFIGSTPRGIDLRWIATMFDTISLEDFNSYWFICRIIAKLDPNRNISFCKVYHWVNPMAKIISNIRFFVRGIIKK